MLKRLFDYTQRALSFGTYSFQSYSVLQVLGASNMNQGEANVRDHLHGVAGVLALGHTFTNPAHTFQALTDASTVVWNMNLGHIATLQCSGAATNRTILASNLVPGTSMLHIWQSASGSNTASYGSNLKWQSAVAPGLTSVSSAHDIVVFACDSSFGYGSMISDVR